MMVSYYGYEIRLHKKQVGKPLLGENEYSFQLLVLRKVKLVDKMMESTYLCVFLHVKLKKLPILAFFT